MIERIYYNERGLLDHVVVNGGAHLERLEGGDKRGVWFLELVREDGTSICLWFAGALVVTEERPAPQPTTLARGVEPCNAATE